MTEFNFSCITQYSSEFAEITSTDNMKGRNFCPFFSLITANQFLIGKNYNKRDHEGSIARSIMCHVLYDKGHQMYFNELIELTDLDTKSIIATTVELVAHNIIGYEQMFPKDDKSRYAVIFLKNGKFFVVLADNLLFSLRDCHETIQYNMFTRQELIKYLNLSYQCDHEIDIDGYKIEEYSNIEFIHIKTPFKTKFDYNISYDIIDKFENIDDNDIIYEQISDHFYSCEPIQDNDNNRSTITDASIDHVEFDD